MRYVAMACALLALAACDRTVTESAETAGAAGGYTLEIRAAQGAQSFLIIAPDGRTVGARAAEGASALMDDERARSLAGEPPPEGEALPEVLGLRLPGFEMSVGATEEDGSGDHGTVNLSIGGRQNVVVRASEGGPGEADDVAYVRISGADERAVRDFIADAEELSPEVKTQMRAALGLNE